MCFKIIGNGPQQRTYVFIAAVPLLHQLDDLLLDEINDASGTAEDM